MLVFYVEYVLPFPCISDGGVLFSTFIMSHVGPLPRYSGLSGIACLFLSSPGIEHGISIFVEHQWCILLTELLCYDDVEAVQGVIFGTETLCARDAMM